MAARSLRREAFVYHDWALGQVLDLARPLDDAGLDQPFSMGFGSLRATLHHLWGAERLWLDRWQQKPWGVIAPFEPEVGVEELAERFQRLAAERDAFFDSAAGTDENRSIRYRRSADEEYTNRLGDLMQHVANHGVHHRAQALNMLRHAGVAVPNIDYLFFRLQHPTIQLPPETVERLAKRGIVVATEPADPARFDLAMLHRYYDYGDWGTERLFAAAASLSDAQLDQPFDMGMGSLRKTLLHIRGAEQWWLESWMHGPESSLPRLPPTTPLQEARELFQATAAGRRDYMAQLTDADLQRTVSARPGGATVISCRMGESMLQLCCHGTHHRAQLLNMLRQLGQAPRSLDLILWLRETEATTSAVART